MKKLPIIILLVVSVCCSIAFFFYSDYQNAKETKTSSSQKYITDKPSMSSSSSISSSSSSSSTEASSSSSDETDKATKAIITDYLESYVTYDLTVKSITDRATTLSKLMTADAYKTAEIQSTTDSLVAITNKWLTTKQIDTSSGNVALVSQAYQSSTVTPSASDKTRFYVELHYKETPATTKESTDKTQLLWLTVANDKVSGVDIITTK
ncbi:hypothetical protein [Lactococcus lactis]|uniref:hypothetical protein n=1 Tax=Lactococcus lactis TaxID=1358 RepID=UPI001911CEFD|nr:hypothetical protein [Lactococcus lactis]WDA70029.1 hypothetical protein IL310_08280 [Lactococcus lactis]